MKTFYLLLLTIGASLGACPCTPELVTRGSTEQNFITTRIPKRPITTATDASHLCRGDLRQSVAYYDGLGRRSQEIAVRITPAGADLVQAHVYDDLGLESLVYPRYATAAEGDGRFRPQAIDELRSFYRSASSVAHTEFPWSETVHEDSPLLRTREQGYPGEPWQPARAGGSSGHTTRVTYRLNAQFSDQVRAWSWNAASQRFESPAPAVDGMLTVEERHDENGHAALTFRDHVDRIVLVRIKNGSGDQPSSDLDTYYVYDDAGDLRLVITPNAVNAMRGSRQWFFDATRDPKWVFQREYDSAHRLIEQRPPGADSRYYVYDALGRVILYQDGNLRRDSKWCLTKYDSLGRVVLTGLYRDYDYYGITRQQFQDQADEHARNNGPLYEQRTNARDDNQGYTNVAFPRHDVEELLTVHYYDDYNFDGNGVPDDAFREVPELAAAYPQRIPWHVSVGKATGMRIRLLDAGGVLLWLQSSVFYDERGREIQAHHQRLTPPLSLGDEWFDTVYDFEGRPIVKRIEHYSEHLNFIGPSSRPPTRVVLTRRTQYDSAGRVHRVFQRVNEQPEILVRENRFNELGVLVERNLHSTDGGRHFLQSLDFSYNTRGWLASLNDPRASGYAGAGDAGVADIDRFAYRLHYEAEDPQRVENEAQWNGNISAMEWAVPPPTVPGVREWQAPDSHTHSYSLHYDWGNRLVAARYRHLNSSGSGLDGDRQYDEEFGYDANGNLKHLERYGVTGGSETTGWFYGPIDRVTLAYRGNQLFSADDAPSVPANVGFKDSTATRGSAGDQEYFYDRNGNLTRDTNAGLASARYNLLNLPDGLELESGASIGTVYSASGEKLILRMSSPGALHRYRYYAGSFIYDTETLYGAETLSYIETPEGRLRCNENGSFTPEYYLTDPGGSVCVVIEPDADGRAVVLEEHHYSPFGRRLEGIGRGRQQDSSRRGFSGKEPLGDSALPWLDFGSRIYDAQLYRWTSLDPDQRGVNPYAFVLNRPLTLTDPDGAKEQIAFEPIDTEAIHGLLREEELPGFWGRLFGSNPNSLEHNAKVVLLIRYVIQLSMEELGADASGDKILDSARTKMINIREGNRSIGKELAPYPSESLILRDAERYLWGRTGWDEFGVPAGILILTGDLGPTVYDHVKFGLMAIGLEHVLRTNPNNPVSAGGGKPWFWLGMYDYEDDNFFPQVPQPGMNFLRGRVFAP